MPTNEMETTLQKQGLIDNSGKGGSKAAEARAESAYQKWAKWAASEETLADQQIIKASLLIATKAVLVKKHIAWQNALEAKNNAIKTAIEEKSVLPDNYWQAEHHAWTIYQAALNTLNALKLELGEKDNAKDATR